MANALYTKNGHNMFEVSSLIQKAIRRSNKDYACYAANELAPRFRKYLWKRLLCVSAEDCYDLVTNKIVHSNRLMTHKAGRTNHLYSLKRLSAFFLPQERIVMLIISPVTCLIQETG